MEPTSTGASSARLAVWEALAASKFVLGVLKALTRPATQAQLDAMVDLAYKIGASVFQSSTLVRLFIAGD
uniref:glycoside hydrolase family protein n=1 Tax=Alcaligenes faecalis TaxID=511 RepID=UPI003D0705BB